MLFPLENEVFFAAKELDKQRIAKVRNQESEEQGEELRRRQYMIPELSANTSGVTSLLIGSTVAYSTQIKGLAQMTLNELNYMIEISEGFGGQGAKFLMNMECAF